MSSNRCLFTIIVASTIVGQAYAAQRRAVIITGDLPGHGPALIGTLTEQLTTQQYEVATIPAEQLLEVGALTTNPPDLLVLPNASVVPARAVAAIERYLRTGGDLIALRTPLSLHAPIRIGGKWINKDEYLASQAIAPLPNILFDLSDGLKGWHRQTNHPGSPITVEPITGEPAPGQHAVHIKMSSQAGWDTHKSPANAPLIPAGHTFTMLAAKGSDLTQSLSVEWQEKDGSRWIAVVALSKTWKRHVLAPSDFKFWPSIPNRGHKGDTFNPANAGALQIGLAHSHTGLADGPQEYWLGPIGTAARTPDLEALQEDIELSPLDTLYPSYKMFDCTGVSKVDYEPYFAPYWFSVSTGHPMSGVIRSPHPRAAGGGFDKGRGWRFAPILKVSTADGQWRGNPATLMYNADGPFKGGIWASLGIDEEVWYTTREARDLLGRIIERMRYKIALLDGGTDKYTYFDGQPIAFGARVANLAEQPMQAQLRARLIDATTKQAVQEKTWQLALKPGEIVRLADTYTVNDRTTAGFNCNVELSRGGKQWDSLTNEAYIWRPRKEKHYVTIQNGTFILDGKRWRPHGINYMPSSGIGVEDWGYFANWTSTQAYDPTVIDRDLRKIKELGYNSVSVFTFHDHIKCQNAVDLLRRCDDLGLKVNLSLRPGTVMNFPWPLVKEMIEGLRLAENDTLFAYDLDWEPLFHGHDARIQWDRDWEAWIVERYGSIASAEKDWHFAAPRDAAGKLTNPLHDHIVADGPWRIMVAAYRRFLDTLLYHKYSAARRLVRGIDRNHHVSFRMTEAGDPTCRWSDMIPYDFPYLAHAVDILEPEAYGRLGDWEKVKPGWFEREYARWADPGKPMIWAEMGMHAWDVKLMSNSPELLAKQADFYRHFYRMMIASSADGVYSWWYPGGFRCGENSDYGVINPDGSDRPVTKVIREMGPRLINGSDLKPVDTWIEFDRDESATGIVGAYDKVKDAYWKAIDAGRTPGLRTAGTGTDSRNCPPLAVGNTPFNGTKPHKYLDAAFDLVEIQDAAGKWLPVTKHGEIAVGKNSSVRIRVGLTNLGEAAWVSQVAESATSESTGHVALLTQYADATLSSRLPRNISHGEALQDFETTQTIPLADSPIKIALRLAVVGRGEFGERFTFTLLPN